jgi:hypothetical protein
MNATVRDRRYKISPPHDVNGQDPALVTGQEIINEITDDGIGFVPGFCHDTANECAAAAVPFQVDGAMRGFAVNFGPAVGPTGTHMFGRNKIEALELLIVHDLFAQRSAPGRDHLNYGLH